MYCRTHDNGVKPLQAVRFCRWIVNGSVKYSDNRLRGVFQSSAHPVSGNGVPAASPHERFMFSNR